MAEVEGTRTFLAPAQAYDDFMGRYSVRLAPAFADFAGIVKPMRVLDVGCGPGALTGELVARLGADSVSAVDPTPGFVQACAARHPRVQVVQAPAESLPFPDMSFATAAAQLVLHFVSDAPRAAAELSRVVRPGGTIAACVWDFAEGMELLRAFWDAALSVDPLAPDEARTLRFGGHSELTDLFLRAGLKAVTETELRVSADYSGFEEVWRTFGLGIGPAGAYLIAQPPPRRDAIRSAMYERLDRPEGPLTLAAVARATRGTVPSAQERQQGKDNDDRATDRT